MRRISSSRPQDQMLFWRRLRVVVVVRRILFGGDDTVLA